MFNKTTILAIIGVLLISSGITGFVVYATEEEKNKLVVEVERNFDVDRESLVIEEVIVEEIVWDGLTRQQLIDKINLSLNSTISGKGSVIVDQCLSLGVDPYLATAIILHETGCKWNCSTLVTACNNVGGQKGGPTCGSGSYKYYETLDEGINGVIANIYNNYYVYGLTTPETIGPKYAASTVWAEKIWNYIWEVQNK